MCFSIDFMLTLLLKRFLQAAVKVQALERGRKARKQVRSDCGKPHRLVEFGHLQVETMGIFMDF